MKVCVLSFEYLYTDGRGPTRILKEVRSLANAGYEVKAIGLRLTGDLPENESYYGVQIRRINSAFGFDRMLQREVPKQRLIGSIKRLYTLTIKNTLASGLALFEAAWIENADIYHCFGVYSLVPGFLLKIIRKKVVIYDAVEPVPQKVEMISSLGPFAKPLSKVVKFVEDFVASKLDYILVTPSAENKYFERFRRGNKNVIVLRNTPPPDWKGVGELKLLEEYSGQKILLYMGAFIRAKGILKLMKAFNIACERFSNIKLVLVGSFEEAKSYDRTKEEFLSYIQSHGLQDHVIITGHIPWQEIPKYLRIADIALHTYQPFPGLIENEGTPSLFEYMSASLPIIASDFPAYEAIKRYNCGITVDPTNEQEIASAVLKLLDDSELAREMGRNARKAFEQEFNWGLEEKKLLQVYSELANR